MAPMLTVLAGPAWIPPEHRLEDSEWELFSLEGGPNHVSTKIDRMGVELFHVGDNPVVPMIVSEKHDDNDAALAFLNRGGMLIKLPNLPSSLDGAYYRWFVVEKYVWMGRLMEAGEKTIEAEP